MGVGHVLAPAECGRLDVEGKKELRFWFSLTGVHIARKIDKLGMRSSDTAEVFFDDVRVPCKNIIGQEGLGFTYQMLQFQEERLWAAANSEWAAFYSGLTPAVRSRLLYLSTLSSGHDGQHHSGDHPVHTAEEDLQAAGPLPPVGSLPLGGASDGGGAAALSGPPGHR